MPIYMDRHDAEGATLEGCANSHKKDLASRVNMAFGL
jgi:hypothetical protein